VLARRGNYCLGVVDTKTAENTDNETDPALTNLNRVSLRRFHIFSSRKANDTKPGTVHMKPIQMTVSRLKTSRANPIP
jgi:hypothetical protein